MSFPDDCGECRVCGCPVFGSLGVTVCASCETPRDNKGRFIKRPAPPKYPTNGDRVFIQEYAKRNPFTGYGTVVDDRWDDELNLGVMLVNTDAGEQREFHAGWMKVVE